MEVVQPSTLSRPHLCVTWVTVFSNADLTTVHIYTFLSIVILNSAMLTWVRFQTEQTVAQINMREMDYVKFTSVPCFS